MKNTLPRLTESKVPTFFDRLAEAEAIQVREVLPGNMKGLVSSLEKLVQTFDNDSTTDDNHFFFVHVKSPVPDLTVTPSPPPLPPEDLMKCAELLLRNQDFILARNIYSYILKTDIKNLTSLKGLGICLLRLGELSSAKKCFRAAWEVHMAQEALLWLAECHLTEKDEPAAEKYLEQIQHPDKLNSSEQFEFYKNFGNYLTRKGDYTKAEAHYRKALELVPNSDVLFVNMGTLELQRNALRAAEQFFNKALELNSQSARAYCGLGLIAQAEGNGSRAVENFNHALELDPLSQVALFQLVSLSRSASEINSVIQRLVKFVETNNKHAEAHYVLASLYFKVSRWKECEQAVEQTLSLQPDHARAQKLKSEVSQNHHHTAL